MLINRRSYLFSSDDNLNANLPTRSLYRGYNCDDFPVGVEGEGGGEGVGEERGRGGGGVGGG